MRRDITDQIDAVVDDVGPADDDTADLRAEAARRALTRPDGW